MNEKIQAYKARLEKQLKAVESAIALKERSKSRIMDKLKDVEDSFSKELKRGAVKVSKIAGVEPDKKTKTSLKKNLGVSGASEKSESVAAPAAPAKTEKPSSWNPFA